MSKLITYIAVFSYLLLNLLEYKNFNCTISLAEQLFFAFLHRDTETFKIDAIILLVTARKQI